MTNRKDGGAVRPVKDSEGNIISVGDIISFSYGIPPKGVKAPVIERDGKLIAVTKGHYPSECNVRTLKKYVGDIFLHKKADAMLAEREKAGSHE